MKQMLGALVSGDILSREMARESLAYILDGSASAACIGAFLTIFRMRDPTEAELTGFREVLLERAQPLDLTPYAPLDIVGTGGDGKSTFNISTLAAFVIAGAGIKVAKHGNYGASSACGSSNLLEALGVAFPRSQGEAERQIEAAGITFLHAPIWHPALKLLGPVRRELGFRTVFNLLGPLVNPASPSLSLLGTCNRQIQILYARTLVNKQNGLCVLHSLDGHDEFSLTSDCSLLTSSGEEIITAGTFGLRELHATELSAKATVAEAAREASELLAGETSSPRAQVILANAAIAIRLARPCHSLNDAYRTAAESLASGAASRVLKTLRNVSSGREGCFNA